jgi:hypothetical protein
VLQKKPPKQQRDHPQHRIRALTQHLHPTVRNIAQTHLDLGSYSRAAMPGHVKFLGVNDVDSTTRELRRGRREEAHGHAGAEGAQ